MLGQSSKQIFRDVPETIQHISMRLLSITGLFFCFGLSFSNVCSQANGQGFFNNTGPAEPTLIEAPREMERLLAEAREHIDQKVWSEATLAVGIVLGLEEAELESDWTGQDYFIATDPKTSDVSIRQQAVALLDSMPEAGQKVIELRYGVQAQQTFDESVATHQWSGIADVARKYPFTQAGREAKWLLAEERLGRGLPVDAAVMLQSLMSLSKAKEQFGVRGLMLLASCWLAAGKEDLALSTIDAAKEIFPKSKLAWKGSSIDLSKESRQALEQLNQLSLTATVIKENEPGWVGGDLQRNADTSMGLPVPLTNWKYWMHESVQHEESAIKTIKQKQTDRNSTLVPSRVPIVAYPWVIVMSYGQRINAINLKTGKMVWGSSFNSIPYELSMDRFAFRDGQSSGIVAQDYLTRRIWGESAIGQLSSDGKNLYCLAELASVDAAESLALGIHANVARPIARRNFNCLQSLSIAEQGKLLWEVGGETGLSDPALAGVLFLGTPVTHESELLTLGELNGEIFLFALDPMNGQLRWRQQLVANSSGPLASDPNRRNQSCVPSISGGLCICPTLSGQLIAVDLNTRSLVWSLPYTQNATILASRVNAFGTQSGGDVKPMEMRSSDAGVIISGDCIVHAPSDGETVYACGLLDGKLRWELSKNSILYVATGWDNRILLVGDQLLYCVDAETGKNAWERPLPLANIGRVVGRGCRNGNRYYLPMSNQEILDIDLNEGKIVDRMRVALPLGNLVATSDQIISLSPVELTAYSIRDRVRAEVDLEFASGNVTSTILQRKSKIHLAEGNLEQAIDAAEQAYRLDRKDPEVQHLLRHIALRALQDNFEKYASRVKDYEELISTGPERTQYLISVIDGLVRRGESVSVTQKLLELQSDLNQRRFSGPSLGETIDPEPNLTVQNDIWTSAKLAQLYDASEGASRAAMVDLIANRIIELTKSIAMPDAESRSDLFRWLPMAKDLRFAIAEHVLREGDLLLAEQLLEEAVLVTSNSTTDKILSSDHLSKIDRLRLAIYNEAGRWTTTVPIANRIGQSLDTIRTEPNTPASGSSNAMIRKSRLSLNSVPVEDIKRFAGGVKSWPTGKVLVQSREVDRPLQSMIGSSQCPIKQLVGTAFQGWNVFFQQGAIEFVGPTGAQRLTVPTDILPRGMGPTGTIAHVIDSIVVLELPTELIAVDTLRTSMLNNDFTNPAGDCILWREAFGNPNMEDPNRLGGGTKLLSERTPWGSERVKNRRGFAVGPASEYGIIVMQGTNLISLDPRTGTRRWVRGGFGSQLTLAQEKSTLIVLDAVKSERLLIDVRDGRLIATHPLQEKVEVWTTAGKNILTAKVDKSAASSIVFRLWDGISGETLVQKIFPQETRAEVLSSSGNNPACLIIWQANKPLVFWNLQSAKESTYDIPNKVQLSSIALERTGDQILVLPYASSLKLDMVQNEDPDRYRKVAGPMIAIDPQDGHPVWDGPVVVNDYRFPVTQSRITPALILVRPLKFKANGVVQTETGSVAILDIRNGNLLHSDNYLFSARGSDFQCLTRLGASEVTLQYRGSEVQVTWTNDPIPDATPELPSQQTRPTDLGKVDRKTLQAGVPAKLLERLQSPENSSDPLGRDADYDQLFKQEEDR